jgi:hypothetical protein
VILRDIAALAQHVEKQDRPLEGIDPIVCHGPEAAPAKQGVGIEGSVGHVRRPV